MTGPASRGGSRGSSLDRFLRLFTDVRPGEANTALLLALNVFILLTAYSALKVLREPLILDVPGGAALKSYSSAGQAIVLVFLVPLYGLIARRVPRRTLINVVTAFFVGCLLLFFALYRLKVFIGVPFYIWQGVFNLMIIAQFWSFTNDLYTTDEGKRLFPIVMLGASVGAVVGSTITAVLIRPLGLSPLFFVAAGLLVLAAVITNIVDVRERRRTEGVVPEFMQSGQIPAATPQVRTATGEFKVPGEAHLAASGTLRAISREDLERARSTPAAPPPLRPTGAFALVFTNRYLLLIALLMLLLNCVNAIGEYVLDNTLTALAPGIAAREGTTSELIIAAYKGGYQATVNIVALLLQLFVVARVIKYLGVRVALLVMPVIAFAGYGVMAFVPILMAIRWAKTAENATDYSLQNTIRQALFLPTTREEKYAAKQAIDGFFMRMGDVSAAVLVYFGTHYYLSLGSLRFEMGTRHFALLNMAFIAMWLAVAVAIGRRYERLVAATP